MIFRINKNSSLNSFLPPVLKKEKVYEAVVISQKKKDLVLEFSNLNLLYNQSASYLYNMQESRFWLYHQMEELEQKNYYFCFKTIDLSNNLIIFDAKKGKLDKLQSFIYTFNKRQSLVSDLGKTLLLKSRILRLVKGGYVLSFYGITAFLKSSSLLPKPRNFFSYSIWFSANIHMMGLLNSFSILEWKVSLLRDKNNVFSNRLRYYFFHNKILKSYIQLKKN